MSALTPPTDMPTPTTDKITQAAMETIYLCKFRVSMDGEWLCLRELDDISLTPDPEPTQEDNEDRAAQYEKQGFISIWQMFRHSCQTEGPQLTDQGKCFLVLDLGPQSYHDSDFTFCVY